MKKIKILVLLACLPTFFYGQGINFTIDIDTSKYIKNDRNFSGRLFVLMNSDTTQLALYWPNTSNPQPAFALDVENFIPGHKITIDTAATKWLHSLEDLEGYYSVSVLFDIDTTLDNLLAPGNLVSDKQIIRIEKGKKQTFNFKIDYPIYPYPFNETDLLKEIQIESKLLTDFYGTPSKITGAVILPKSYYRDTTKTYPVVYVFPGWGGNRFHIVMGDFNQKRYGMSGFGEEKIFVFMDQQCRYGYHVFANSENNGPRDKSFVNEFIPAFEKKYRVGRHRFLIGQSSGGWATLWLQVKYPDIFDGAWAASPDPIDFRHFESMGNMYDHKTNVYSKTDGTPKIHARKDGKVIISNRDYILMEILYGEGQQFGSYESVFSKRGDDGKPMQVFSRETGYVVTTVSENWKKYDLRYIIENAEEGLLKKLSDKIHIHVANDDNYFLDLGVRGFEEAAENLEFEVDIHIYNEMGHDVWNDSLRYNIHSQIDNICNRFK